MQGWTGDRIAFVSYFFEKLGAYAFSEKGINWFVWSLLFQAMVVITPLP